MCRKNKIIYFGIAISLVSQFAMGQGQDSAIKLLISQARYWQAKNDYARAATIWNKVLLTDPNQPEALYGIAQGELKKTNLSGVNISLGKLKKVDPQNRYIALLEQDVSLSSSQNTRILSNAQELAAAGKADEAVAQYNILFGGKEPQGNIALEYYSTLSNTNGNGWSASRTGLERLSRQYPQDAKIKLQLAKTLLLRESSRVEGLDQLSQLANSPEVGSEALESWRLGLTWYKVPQPNAFPVFERYLKAHPDDTEIQAQLNAGIEQQKRLALRPKNDATLQDTRATDLFVAAKKSLANGDDASARVDLEKSLKFDADNPWARLQLASLYIKSGQNSAARDLMYTMPYRNKGSQTDVLFATALYSLEIKDFIQAQTSLNQIPANERTAQIKELQKSLVLREQIASAIALGEQGRKADGLAILGKLDLAVPKNLSETSLIANAYIELGDKTRGINLMRQSFSLNATSNPDELLTYAALLLKANEDIETATILAKLQQTQLTTVERTAFNNLLFAYSLRQADELRSRGNIVAAEDRLAPLLVERPNDPQVIASLAEVYQASGENKKALDLYKLLVEKNPRNIDIQLGAARLAVQVNEYGYANTRLQAALTITPKDPNVIASVARIYRSAGKTKEAELLFEQALSIMASSRNNLITTSQSQTFVNKQFTARSVPTLSNSTIPLPAASVQVVSAGLTSDKSVFYQMVPASEPQRLIMADLNEIKQERSPEILIGTQVRNRSGVSGTSQITDIETPLEIRLPAGDGKAIVQVTPVSLNAGSISSNNYSLSTFGNGNTAGNQSSQTAAGVGVSLGYKMNGLAVDVGTTPVGFTYSNFAGGIKLDGLLDEAKTLSYVLNISSRPVTDSLLSFSGAKDSISGLQWGGVMASGGRLGTSKDLGGFGFYGTAALHSVNGHNVQSNSRSEFGGGAYANIYKRPDSELTSGLNFTNLSYKNNLSNFTYGQGGYFSPQQYNALTVPVTWSAQSNHLTYQLRAAVGYQSYSQNASSYFPTNAGLQAASGNPIYTSLKASGAAYNLAAGSEYQVAQKLFLGASAQTDNTATGTWHQWGAGLYLRYSFESIDGPMAMPLKSFTSPYGQ
jgi:Tfp pilus assembly protein PilF